MNVVSSILMGIATVAAFAGSLGYAAWQASAGGTDGPELAMDKPPAEAERAAPFALTDLVGDARDLGVDRVGYGPGCLIDCAVAPHDPPGAASPDAAVFDITKLTFVAETEGAVTFTLELARLTEGFPELATPGPVRRVAEYAVCWSPSEDDPRRCILVDMAPESGTASLAASFHIRGAESCNDWAWCSYRVPVAIEYGSPGLIAVEVPKSMIAADGAPLAIGSLEAASGWMSTNGAIPLWHAAWTVHANGDHQHSHAGLLEPANVADRLTGPHAPVLLAAPPATGPAIARTEPLMLPGVGNLAGGRGLRDDPALDLVSFDLRQDADVVVATFQMAAFDAMPSYDLQLATIFGVRGGTTYEVGLMRSNGDAYGYAGRCVSFGCHDGYLVQLEYEIVHDAIEVRVPRGVWPTLVDGDEIDLMLAYTMFGEANLDLGTPGAPAYGNVHSGSIVDIAFGGSPFVFPASSVEDPSASHHH